MDFGQNVHVLRINDCLIYFDRLITAMPLGFNANFQESAYGNMKIV